MKLLAVTQRVVSVKEYGERRDALDQRWLSFIEACGYIPLLIPNNPQLALKMVQSVPIEGLLLTGGNNLVTFNGDAPERDETEHKLIDYCQDLGLPVLGVCRGMQIIQEREGITLKKLDGHVAVEHVVSWNNERILVNSYHNFGTTETVDSLVVKAQADDGIIEAVQHARFSIFGIMWHPERVSPFAPRDLELFKTIFGGSS